MIYPQGWAEQWIKAWNTRDLPALLSLYADDIQLRSPFARVYAKDGVIRGKAALEAYWSEVMRRNPTLSLDLVAVFTGHLALSLQYRDSNGRNCIETVQFDERDKAIVETACLDRVR